MAVGRHVKRLVGLQEAQDVRRRRRVDHGRRNELVHRLVVLRVAGVMHQSGTAERHGAGEEGHAQRLVVRDALECADEICAFQILFIKVRRLAKMSVYFELGCYELLIHESIGP